MSEQLYANESYQRALLTEGTREEILAWLQWNDRNGCYTDEQCAADGMPSVWTLEQAREEMAQACGFVEDKRC
jgi:hypothetical protein